MSGTAHWTAMPRLAAAVVLLAAWQAVAMSGLLFLDVVPPLQTVLAGLLGVLADPDFYRNLAVTAAELGVAMLTGGGLGLLVGLGLGGSRFAAAAWERWVNWLGPTPKIVLFPVMLMIFGVGPASKMAMGAVSCFFPMALSVAGGVRGVDAALLRVGHSFRASGAQMLAKIYLPAMAAPLLNGVRLGFGVALIGVLLAETKLSNQGIGYMIIQAYARFDMPRMYALLILSVAVAAGVNMLTARAAARLGGPIKTKGTGMRLILGALLALAAIWPAAAETLKIAIGQRGNWDTAVPEMAQRSGIAKKYGLDLDLLYTAGGGETQQAVLSRSVDVGVAAGTLGVLGAFSKGAPVRIIGAQATGAADYWYVPGTSPIKSIPDLAGHTVAFSTVGSSTNSIVLAVKDQYHLAFEAVATGSPPGTFTQAMSGQIDVGWASPPFGVDGLQSGKIRLLFRGNDLASVRGQTTRVLMTHAAELAQNKPAITRFMQAYRETLDWMYSSPDAIHVYAEYAGVPDAIARSTRDEFFPKAMLEPDHLSGIDSVMADGVKFKFLTAPLTPAQLSQVVQIEGAAP